MIYLSKFQYLHKLVLETVILKIMKRGAQVAFGDIEYRKCLECNMDIPLKEWNYHLRKFSHKRNAAIPAESGIKVLKQNFNGRVETFMLENEDEALLSPMEFLKKSESSILSHLRNSIIKHVGIKFNIELFCEYIKITKNENENDEDEINLAIKSFNTKMEIIDVSSTKNGRLTEIYGEMIQKIVQKTDEFQERDSGWSLVRIVHLEINVNQYQPIRGSGYLPLPVFLKSKKACINVLNDDNYCFKWSIISALYRGSGDLRKTSTYKIPNITSDVITIDNITLRFSSLEFPMKLCDINLFEEMNPNISINVFGYERVETSKGEHYQIVGPYYSTKNEKINHINLLLIQQIGKLNINNVYVKN